MSTVEIVLFVSADLCFSCIGVETPAGCIPFSFLMSSFCNIVAIDGLFFADIMSRMAISRLILSLPENYRVEEIPSGCCGMAGSFGYEKEHYKLSMKVGELVLFPAVRKASPETIIAAPGTSCREQIKDGTSRKALHPVEILHDALI